MQFLPLSIACCVPAVVVDAVVLSGPLAMKTAKPTVIVPIARVRERRTFILISSPFSFWPG